MSLLAAPPRLAAVSTPPIRSSRHWLVGPWFDILLLANVAWPLLVLAQFGEGFFAQAGLEFWQLYYITTPHRWMTLVLVFLDRDRFQQRPATFLVIAAAVLAVCLGVRITTGALTCLLAIDYLWNAWHFAAQHHGIYRIYSRAAEPVPRRSEAWEKWGLRLFLLYVILRVASATWPDSTIQSYLQQLDVVALAAPLWLLTRELRTPMRSAGRSTYLVSMLGLYLALLWAVHQGRVGLVLSLATASALFHAIEYLSLATWSVQQRHRTLGSRLGLLSHIVPRWGIALLTFIAILGAAGWFLDRHLLDAWLTVNVAVAFLHYAYDGLIWRRR